MALFKIKKGLKSNLPKTYNEGYCYFTTDDGKFYIDTSNQQAGRVCLNAEQADTVPNALISNGTTNTSDLGKTWGTEGVSSGNRIYSKCCANLNNGQTTLKNGLIIAIKLPVVGNNSGYCVSINNGNEYHPMVFSNNTIITNHFNANQMLLLMYDGDTSASVYGSSSGAAATSSANITGVWRVMNTYLDGNTIDQLRYSNTRVIAGTNGIYGYNLIALDNNNRWQGFVKSKSTGTSKAINTDAKFRLPINILYYGVNNDATNGNTVPVTYALYAAHPSVDLRYSHNYTTNFTVNTPVYLEGTIDNNGYFSVTTKCITQTLTSGNYYIFLGTSNNSTAYQLHLHTDHPIYYYNGTNLVDYTRKLYGSTLNISDNKITLKNGLDEDLSTISYSTATTSIAGLMSKEDKTKLDSIEAGANKTTVDSALSSTSTNPIQNKVITAAVNTTTEFSNKIKRGINSIINSNDAISINPAVNGIGYSIARGATAFIRFDGFELPVIQKSMEKLFDGKSSTYIRLQQIADYVNVSEMAWNENTQYHTGDFVVLREGNTNKVIMFKALQDNIGVNPINNSNIWLDNYRESTGTYSGSVVLRNITIQMEFRFPYQIDYENGFSLYFRSAGQTVRNLVFETGLSDGSLWYVEKRIDGNCNVVETIPTIGTIPNHRGEKKSIRLTFEPMSPETTWTAFTQICVTGLVGGIEGTLLNRGGGTLYGTVTPETDNAISLGSSTKRWNNIHSNVFTGNLSGNASTATKATQDANGNVITNTYATKTALSGVSNLVGNKPVSEQISTALEGTMTVDITNAEQGSATLINADTLGGKRATEFASSSDLNTAVEGLVRTKIITAILSLDSWSSSTPSTQTKTAVGVTPDCVCMVDLNMAAIDASSIDAIQEAWAHVDKIITSTDQITAYCYGQVPTAHIPIKIVVFD